MKFCSHCGELVVRKVPNGDNRERFVCESCDTVHYQNPRVITGCIAAFEDQVLLARRAINPRAGYWTLPAGFLENGETASAGAARETLEEAKAAVEIIDLYAVFSLPHISQMYCFYRATLPEPKFAAGEESTEVALFRESDVPWEELAFPVIRDTLQFYFEDRSRGRFEMRARDIVIDPAELRKRRL